MRKLLSLTALTLALTVATTPPAFAQSANAASVVKDVGCSGFVPGGGGLFTTESHSVVTSSGVTSLICNFDIPAGSEPLTATRAVGFGCGTFLGFTTDSKMVASPGGNATLTCKINGAP